MGRVMRRIYLGCTNANDSTQLDLEYARSAAVAVADRLVAIPYKEVTSHHQLNGALHYVRVLAGP